MIQFRIDPEFANKIPPIGQDEFNQLRENILAAGEVYEPLVVWKEEQILMDGHNRWKVIEESPSIVYKVREMSFPDKWAAFEWMYKNQLGRRNLTDEQRTYAIGKMYEARKKTAGNSTSIRNADGTFQSAQIGQDGKVTTSDKNKHGVSGELAIELNIGRNTVRRAEKFTKGVDALREVNPEAADKVLSGKTNVSRGAIGEIPKMRPDEIQDAVEKILSDDKAEQRKVGAKVSRVRVNSEEDRQRIKDIEAIVADMYDPTTAPEFTIDFLIEDIEANANIYIELLKNTFIDRANLITEENKPRIIAAIDNIISEIEKVREML